MIKPGKVCSQLMKTNNTGETNIKLVGKYFRLTFVFNALKTSLNLCLSSPIALKLFLIFEIRVVLSFKTCLEGGNLVNLTIHAPWCITGCPSNIFYQTTCKGQAWGGSQGFLQEYQGWMWAREYGGDSKRKHQVEGAIMQAKEWTRTFGRCMRSRSNKTSMSAL
jgi:hypothetical protein